jgi:hypothetical protein
MCRQRVMIYLCSVNHEPLIRAVDAIGMTVGDMDRSVGFFQSAVVQKNVRCEGNRREYEQLQVRDTGESLSFCRVMLGFSLLVKVRTTTLSRST